MAPYHHGHLRQALLNEARALIDEQGAGALTLRELARRLGVSHAAPLHHFADKRALLTAVATEGFERLADALEAVPASGDLVELGMAYVHTATTHRAEFSVMFRRDLIDGTDEQLRNAQARARAGLRTAVDGDTDRELAAWSIAHGLAQLVNQGALDAEITSEADMRRVLGVLAGPDRNT
jgi:AcrR family transcriptional regulator